MKAESAFGAVNWALGLMYIGWVAATVVLGRVARRRGDRAAGQRSNRAVGWLCRLGAVVGIAVLAAGLIGTWVSTPPRGADRLIWPGVVYPATALVIWIRRRVERPGRTGER